jgi:preprotein translocase subunit SecE
VSDERDRAGSAGTGTDTDTDGTEEARGQTAVVTRPMRPTGKRTRRAAAATTTVDGTDTEVEDSVETEAEPTKDGAKKPKKKTKKASGPSRNPLLYIINYLKQVVAELRKVIWPSRKQMVSYTTVVLVFLAFMVALIFGVDYGLIRLVNWIFG